MPLLGYYQMLTILPFGDLGVFEGAGVLPENVSSSFAYGHRKMRES